MSVYRDYYRRCREAYEGRGAAALGIYRLGVHSQVAGVPRATDLLPTDPAYQAAVDALAAAVDLRFVARDGLFEGADPQVRRLALQLDRIWDLPGLEEITAVLVPHLERTVLGCHGLVNQINVIRSLPSAAPPATSWLWHYDNNPDEAFKVLVYLTDVDASTGAFEYLCRDDGEVVKIPSSRRAPDDVLPPRWPGSRVPQAEIERLAAAGFVPRRVTGPRGTAVLFDNNCVHRATVPRERHRDAVILNLRPAHRPLRPFVSPRHTGSWAFNAKSWVPEELELAGGEAAR